MDIGVRVLVCEPSVHTYASWTDDSQSGSGRGEKFALLAPLSFLKKSWPKIYAGYTTYKDRF